MFRKLLSSVVLLAVAMPALASMSGCSHHRDKEVIVEHDHDRGHWDHDHHDDHDHDWDHDHH